jgi:hypothetical protein
MHPRFNQVGELHGSIYRDAKKVCLTTSVCAFMHRWYPHGVQMYGVVHDVGDARVPLEILPGGMVVGQEVSRRLNCCEPSAATTNFVVTMRPPGLTGRYEDQLLVTGASLLVIETD